MHLPDSDSWQRHLDELDVHAAGKTSSYSLLRQLREEYGLDAALANTVQEERDYTNALIIVDTIVSLRTSWIGKRAYFDRGSSKKPRFLGTQLVWLSRQLDVLAESVRDAYAAMDSVYFGAAERAATDIRFEYLVDVKNPAAAAAGAKARELAHGAVVAHETHAAPLSVAELLEWVETFATAEGPQLLQDAGKDGVLAFRSTVSRLARWVGAARAFAEAGSGPAPRSFFTSRVQFVLREIENQLAVTGERATGISRSTCQWTLSVRPGMSAAMICSGVGAFSTR